MAEQTRDAELAALIAEQRADDRAEVQPEYGEGRGTVVEGYGAFIPFESAEDALDGWNGYVVARSVKVTEPWKPSMVSERVWSDGSVWKQRPHVEHVLARHDGVEGLRAELEAIPARLKGRKGKSRQLLKAKRDRLARAVAAFEYVEQREAAPWSEPPTYPEAVIAPKRPTQAEYYLAAPWRP